jgi:hypothetical protein
MIGLDPHLVFTSLVILGCQFGRWRRRWRARRQGLTLRHYSVAFKDDCGHFFVENIPGHDPDEAVADLLYRCPGAIIRRVREVRAGVLEACR